MTYHRGNTTFPHVVVILDPDLLPPAHRGAFALDPPVLRVYAEHRVDTHTRCPQHWPHHVNRFGDGWCRCGARMWSPWWVQANLVGFGERLAAHEKASDDDPMVEVDEQLDGTAAWIRGAEAIWNRKALA